MNLKERLTSTENLLRSIRSGEAFPTGPKDSRPEGAALPKGSIWTRRISLGDVFSGLIKRPKPAATAPSAATAQPAAPAPMAHSAPSAPRAATPAAPSAPPPRSAPPTSGAAATAAPTAKGSIWTRHISLRELFSGSAGSSKARQGPQEAKGQGGSPPGQKPAPRSVWTRQINLGRGGKTFCIGVSVSGPSLCIAVVRSSSGAIAAARRFRMEQDQAPGEKGFQALLDKSLETLGFTGANTCLWAVLRSADLDLNIVSVPKLAGSKLDAAVYWTLQKEKKFAEAEYVLDYRVMGPTAETKEPKLDVLTCLARRADVERLREAFRSAGRPLAGITAIPNSLLNLYQQPGAPRGYTLAANIHVEPDFSAIGLYTQNRLVFSRFIRSGAGSMAETLVDHFREASKPRPVPTDDLELPLPGAPKAAAPSAETVVQALDSVQAQALLRHVLLGAPRPPFATPAHLLGPQQMLEIVGPAIERLSKQVERTLDYYATTQQSRCDALHLSGEIFSSGAITQALGGQLGFTPSVFDATAIVNDGGGLVPPEDRMTMAPALAAALSQPGRGINLLDNYKVRTARDSKRAVTRSLVLGLALVMVLIGGAGFMLERANALKAAELQQLKTQMSNMGPVVDESSLLASVGQFKNRQDALREASKRLLASAALAEVARRAPENIKIISLVAEYPADDADAPGAPAKPGQPQAPGQPPAAGQAAQHHGRVVLEGVVSGSKVEFDATLSRFILEMQASPMFGMPVVNETSIKELGNHGQVLYFVMHLAVK